MKWFNAVQDAGFGEQMQLVSLTDCVVHDAVIINELYSFPWFDVDMGSDQRAAGLVFPQHVLRNYWAMLPRERESGDLTFHASFRRGEGDVFLRTIEYANMPFYKVRPHCK